MACGAYWCLLVLIGAYWCLLLVLIGAYLLLIGAYWCHRRTKIGLHIWLYKYQIRTHMSPDLRHIRLRLMLEDDYKIDSPP